MNTLSKALGKQFDANKNVLRIRSFEFNGHIFKVKVPLTVESDAMAERLKALDETVIEKYYKELSEQFYKNKEEIDKEDLEIEFKKNDVVVKGRSLREAAKNKLLAETRIVEMFKLLVPEEVGFDMATITYEMIEELFPFAIQMQLLELISETISPGYAATKGK